MSKLWQFIERVLQAKITTPTYHAYLHMGFSSLFLTLIVLHHSECVCGSPFLSCTKIGHPSSVSYFLAISFNFHSSSRPLHSVSRGQILPLVSRPLVTSHVRYTLLLPPMHRRCSTNIHCLISSLLYPL